MAMQNEDTACIAVSRSKLGYLTAFVIDISETRGRSNKRTIMNDQTSGDLYRSFRRKLECYEGRFDSQADESEFFENCISISRSIEALKNNRELESGGENSEWRLD